MADPIKQPISYTFLAAVPALNTWTLIWEGGTSEPVAAFVFFKDSNDQYYVLPATSTDIVNPNTAPPYTLVPPR